MSLNLLYSPEPSLQEAFIDKSTGLPLSFGLVFFYSDVNRNVLKPIYTLSGSPPNYTYTQLPNPVILSGIGTIQDGNGNDVIPYFYPFDSNGNTELYYIVVTDQFGVQQFTRQGFPNVGPLTPSNVVNFTENFVPNGQFLLWNPPASYPSTKYTFDYAGTLGVTDVIDVAPGGWNFQVSTGSTATYTIQFNQLLSALLTPPASPRYEIEIIRSLPSGPHADTICDLRIRFMDVNKFQSTGINDTWSLLFNAESVSTLSNVTIHLIKYFGTNGTSATPADTSEDILWGGPLTIGTSQQTFVAPNAFGINTGKSIGNNNNDFIEFAIRFPSSASQVFDVKLTDFMLINQNVTPAQASSIDFPPTTNGEFVLQAISNLAPTTTSSTTTNYYQEDGSNLYLPMIMTQRGYTYDYSQIGTIIAKVTDPVNNEVLCNGQSFVTNDYSPLGIPYKRLQKVLFNTTTNLPRFGTGNLYLNAYINTGDTTQLILQTNSANLPQIVPADGTTATGWTFVADYNISTVGYVYIAHSNSNAIVTAVLHSSVMPIAGATAGTSGMTVVNYTEAAMALPFFTFQLTALAAAALSTGLGNPAKYFTFTTNTVSYYMWFNVAGEVDPAPGGTGIKCNLTSSMNAIDVGIVIASTITSYQTNYITVTGMPPAGSYFTFHANSVTYVVWFKVASTGSQPPLGSTPVYLEVDLLGTETNAQIATKVQIAINSYSFAVPDLMGVFLRGNDPSGTWDIEHAKRFFVTINNLNPDLYAGSFEVGQMVEHAHPGSTVSINTGLVGGGGATFYSPVGAVPTSIVNIAPSGGTENRPINMSVNWYMKY